MLRVGPQWGVTVVRNCPCMLLIKKTKNIIMNFMVKCINLKLQKEFASKLKLRK